MSKLEGVKREHDFEWKKKIILGDYISLNISGYLGRSRVEIRLDSKVWRVNYRSDVWRGGGNRLFKR